jgi:hypothetical protein
MLCCFSNLGLFSNLLDFCGQSTSLASDLSGKTPVLSKLVKAMAHATGRTFQLGDNDVAMKFIATQHRCIGPDNNLTLKDKENNKARAKLTSGAGVPVNASAQSSSSPPGPPHFHYLVLRPTLLITEGPALKRLSASKSVSTSQGFVIRNASGMAWSLCRQAHLLCALMQQPGPFSISSGDLAEFMMSALLDTRLYDSCPYVVSVSGF